MECEKFRADEVVTTGEITWYVDREKTIIGDELCSAPTMFHRLANQSIAKNWVYTTYVEVVSS